MGYLKDVFQGHNTIMPTLYCLKVFPCFCLGQEASHVGEDSLIFFEFSYSLHFLRTHPLLCLIRFNISETELKRSGHFAENSCSNHDFWNRDIPENMCTDPMVLCHIMLCKSSHLGWGAFAFTKMDLGWEVFWAALLEVWGSEEDWMLGVRHGVHVWDKCSTSLTKSLLLKAPHAWLSVPSSTLWGTPHSLSSWAARLGVVTSWLGVLLPHVFSNTGITARQSQLGKTTSLPKAQKYCVWPRELQNLCLWLSWGVGVCWVEILMTLTCPAFFPGLSF